jgi:hypothetical protein
LHDFKDSTLSGEMLYIPDRIKKYIEFIPSQVPKSGPGAPSIGTTSNGVEESHPSRKNKYAARVGHPNSIPIGEML